MLAVCCTSGSQQQDNGCFLLLCRMPCQHHRMMKAARIKAGVSAKLSRMMQGNTGGIRNKLEQDLKPAVLMNWKIWVPFQFLNFRFIPLNLQVILILLDSCDTFVLP